MSEANFNIIPPPAGLARREEILHAASKDLITFGKIFLPKDFLFKEESPKFHYDIGAKLISTTTGTRIANIIPRGFAKTILSKAAILYKIYFGKEDMPEFICWVGEEQGQAIDNIRYIRDHIDYNEQFAYYFGELSGDSVGNRWTEKDIVTAKGDRVIAKGTTQKLRGKTEKELRYTGVVLDDFESELNTKTPERRKENRKWLVSTVFPALEETRGREGWIWLNGTIVHYDSFLQSVLDGYNEAKKDDKPYTWDVTFQRATHDGMLNDDSIPLWPDRFSIKKLRVKRREFIDAGRPDQFAQEFMNDARDIGTMSFNTQQLADNYHNGEFKSDGTMCYLVVGEGEEKEVIPINIGIGWDVAFTATDKSDYQGVVVMGIDSEKHRYVLERLRERIPAYDMSSKVRDLAAKYRPVRMVTIETASGGEIARDVTERFTVTDRRLMPGIIRKGKPLSLEGKRIKKEDRLETALAPLVNSGRLHIRKEHQDIIEEMYQFPKGSHDDMLDALFYADYYIRDMPPRSVRFKYEGESMFDDLAKKRKTTRKRYNWLTGARIA